MTTAVAIGGVQDDSLRVVAAHALCGGLPDFRTRQACKAGLLHACSDADDLHPVGDALETDTGADGVLPGEESADERIVDDSHARRASTIGAIEGAALQYRDSQNAEVIAGGEVHRNFFTVFAGNGLPSTSIALLMAK